MKRESYREKITVRHAFTADEFQAVAKRVQEISQQSAQIKAKCDQLKGDLKMLEATSANLVSQISEGCEMVEVEAEVRLDRKKGVKRYYVEGYGYEFDGAPVKTEQMTEADYQRLPGVASELVEQAIRPEEPEEPRVEAADMSDYQKK